nr:sulfite exporter TauE/SafE family protein [uncultured Massilia sp.]
MPIAPLPIFLVGLLGSVHCAGMCGGIVGALSLAPGLRIHARPAHPAFVNVLAYNAGRIASYMAAGALAGALAQGAAAGAQALARLPALQAGAYWLANLMLAALGLYLMDAWRGLAHLERGGQLVWRRVQPLLRRVGPLDGPGRMLAAGALWGWLPCGMVYSVLVTAMLSGSALSGALVMLAFGLGTLPMLLGLGVLGARLRALLRRRGVRIASGVLVLGFGVLGLVRAGAGLQPDAMGWLEHLCTSAGGPS